LVLDAFEPILSSVPEVELTFVGRIGWVAPELVERIGRMRERYPNFTVCPDADDGMARRYVENCRATIYVSAAEGFGLPPVESLWLGTPVIASDGIPSLEEYGSRGICLVQPLDQHCLRQAVISFLDDKFHQKKAAEARRLPLPTWASLAAQVADWLESVSSAR
jgi:glycosyltransferase involved in cell wall biosynthesis